MPDADAGPRTSAARAGGREQARRARRPPPLRPARPAPPRGLQIPALGLRLPVQPEGVDEAGAMALPETVAAAGWYRYGARPGSRAGSAVIAGHLDTEEEGIGPFAGLAVLEAGDEVLVATGRERLTYEVTSVRVVDRADLSLDRLFARTGEPVLHLVTCGGDYRPEQGGYQSNVVVAAAPTTSAGGAPLSSARERR